MQPSEQLINTLNISKNDKRKKTLKTNNDSTAGVVVDDTTSRIHGNEKVFTKWDSNGTITNKGKIRNISMLHDTKQAGIFEFPNQFLSLLPSTIVSMRPLMNFAPPDLENLLTQFSNLLGPLKGIIG